MNLCKRIKCFVVLLTAVVLLAASGIPVSAAQKKKKTVPKPAPAAKAYPAVENVAILDSAEGSQVIVTAHGARHSNYFLLRSPDMHEPPSVVLDIYGATLPHDASAGTVKSEKGAFSEARALLLKESPEPVVRIIAKMREDRQYLVQKEGNGRWNIVVKKETPIVVYVPPENELRSQNDKELQPEVLAVPVSELPDEMKPIERPAPVQEPIVAQPAKKQPTARKPQQTYTTRTTLEQALPWASLGTLILIIAIII